MASEPGTKGGNLTAEGQLRAADRELAQLREVLASMDEIDALRKRDGKQQTNEYGGYKRADVVAMIAELEARRRELLTEISSGGTAENASDSAAARERVTLSDALERLYSAISVNIDRAKSEVLQEVKYACRQNTAIYAELSARIDGLADKVAAKVMDEGIDYDELARRMLARMTSRNDAETLLTMEKRLKELENALLAQRKENDALSVQAQEDPDGTNSAMPEAEISSLNEPGEKADAEETVAINLPSEADMHDISEEFYDAEVGDDSVQGAAEDESEEKDTEVFLRPDDFSGSDEPHPESDFTRSGMEEGASAVTETGVLRADQKEQDEVFVREGPCDHDLREEKPCDTDEFSDSAKTLVNVGTVGQTDECAEEVTFDENEGPANSDNDPPPENQ